MKQISQSNKSLVFNDTQLQHAKVTRKYYLEHTPTQKELKVKIYCQDCKHYYCRELDVGHDDECRATKREYNGTIRKIIMDGDCGFNSKNDCKFFMPRTLVQKRRDVIRSIPWFYIFCGLMVGGIFISLIMAIIYGLFFR